MQIGKYAITLDSSGHLDIRIQMPKNYAKQHARIARAHGCTLDEWDAIIAQAYADPSLDARLTELVNG